MHKSFSSASTLCFTTSSATDGASFLIVKLINYYVLMQGAHSPLKVFKFYFIS